MTDRRTHWSNGRVAHVSLRGQVDADRFMDGEDHTVIATPVAALWEAPSGKMDRQLLTGDRFCVLDVTDGWAFGFARANGYTGYIEAQMLKPGLAQPTHVIRNRLTVARDKPSFKTRNQEVLLSIGTPVHVTAEENGWYCIAGFDQAMYVPAVHTRPITDADTDPVAVAHDLLGTPYVWGGDAAIGIDCSGLVQLCCRLCDIPCPGDSDLQEQALGETLPDGTAPKRGDLLFWKGHVAWVSDPDTILHANVHHMAVAYEPLQDAVARIMAQGDGSVTRHARLTLP